ncbi:MAG: hypothetical protein HGA61_01375 [Candidatus Moranbacteria bacterium]|nr:hypothetical protein [Candidatus Moranbacteria bacterium]
MSSNIVIVLAVILIFYVGFKFFTQSFADFLDKGAKTTLWMWLPFKAFGKLFRELMEKKIK